MKFLRHNGRDYLEVGVRLVGADLLNGRYTVRLEVVVKRGNELFPELVARAFGAPSRIAALAGLKLRLGLLRACSFRIDGHIFLFHSV